MKHCKQCGRDLPEEVFRKYSPRGKGIRKSTQGRNTTCITCERQNGAIAIIWRKENKTEEDKQTLKAAAEYYKKLVAAGNFPVGPYAKYILGEVKEPPKHSLLDAFKESIHILDGTEDIIEQEYDKLLHLELTMIPDVYQELLDKVRSKCLDNVGKVIPQYLDKFNEVATKFDDYEDNYKWE